MYCSPSPKKTAKHYARIGYGLALAFTGFAHYKDPGFAEFVADGLGALEPVGMLWGYILPGLMIIGGLLMAFGIYRQAAAGISSVALASIPAGVMLKSAIDPNIAVADSMPYAVNALVWIIALLFVLKGSCGSGACGSMMCCGSANCACPGCETKEPMPTMKPAPMAKSAAPTPAPKKVVPKKAAPKKASASKKAATKKPAERKKK